MPDLLKLTPQDLYFVQRILAQAIKDTVESQKLTPEQETEFKLLCENAMAHIWELSGLPPPPSLSDAVNEAGQMADLPSKPEAAAVMNENEEIKQLHQQVLEAQQRVDALRQAVPDEVSAALAKQMVVLRPVLEMQQMPESGDDVQPKRDQAPDYAAAVNELSASLSAAVDKVPALKARLDQTVQRLSRIISAFEADKTRASPKTVERVLLNRSPAPGSAAVTPDGATGTAAKANMTRRRLAHDMALLQTAM